MSHLKPVGVECEGGRAELSEVWSKSVLSVKSVDWSVGCV